MLGVGAVAAARTREQALARARTAFTAKVAEARRLERAFHAVFTRANDLVRGPSRDWGLGLCAATSGEQAGGA